MTIEAVDFSRKQAPEPRLSPKRVPGRHAERFWRVEENAVLADYYPTGGIAVCLEKLPGRSRSAICNQAGKLGIKSARQSDAPRKRHPADPDLDAKLRAVWPSLTPRGALQRYADEIGVDRWVLSKRAVALGLTKDYRRKAPEWTAAEDALMKRVPLHDPARASRIFQEHGFLRSPTAIMVRAKRIGLSRRFNEALSATRAAAVLGVDIKWITARCIDGSIACEKRGTRRLSQQGGDTWSIKPEALRRYVLDSLQEVDIRKVDKFAFVALLTAPNENTAAAAAAGGGQA